MALNFHYLNAQLQEMASYFPYLDALDPKVSKVHVGWHLAHCLKVINQVCDALKSSSPENFRSQFNLKREIVFALGSFPRGKAQAPKKVIPEGEIKIEDLINNLERAKKNISEYDSLKNNNFFEHPYFNQLNKIQAKRLLEVHTKHHLKIIREILKKESVSRKKNLIKARLQ